MAGVGDRTQERPIMRGREWRAFGRLGQGTLRSKKRQRRLAQTDAAANMGDFAMSGRTDPWRIKTEGADKSTTEGGKNKGIPRYVSTGDIDKFTTTQKLQHKALNKRIIGIQQPGMGVPGKGGESTPGTLIERWRGGGSRFSGGYGRNPFGR